MLADSCEVLHSVIVGADGWLVIVQEKMARGSGMLNKKHQVFFDEMNAAATEDCHDGIHAAEVRSCCY